MSLDKLGIERLDVQTFSTRFWSVEGSSDFNIVNRPSGKTQICLGLGGPVRPVQTLPCICHVSIYPRGIDHGAPPVFPKYCGAADGLLRNPVKALLVPITQSQMAELQALAEHGCWEAVVGLPRAGVEPPASLEIFVPRLRAQPGRPSPGAAVGSGSHHHSLARLGQRALLGECRSEMLF